MATLKTNENYFRDGFEFLLFFVINEILCSSSSLENVNDAMKTLWLKIRRLKQGKNNSRIVIEQKTTCTRKTKLMWNSNDEQPTDKRQKNASRNGGKYDIKEHRILSQMVDIYSKKFKNEQTKHFSTRFSLFNFWRLNLTLAENSFHCRISFVWRHKNDKQFLTLLSTLTSLRDFYWDHFRDHWIQFFSSHFFLSFSPSSCSLIE